METAYRLSELVNLDELQAMVQANYVATGMPLGIVDAYDGAILVGAGWQSICADFHRAHPVTRQRCLESDALVVEQAQRGSAYEHKCQNGLWDIGIPVFVAGQHAATLFLGQFFYEGEVPDREFFLRQARQFGFDERCYMTALDRAPVFTRAQVENILSYNRALAAFLGNMATQHLVLQREVSERRRAEEALDERNRLLNTLLDNLPIGVFMVEAPSGRPLVANEQARELLGRGILPDANAETLGQVYQAYRWRTGERYPIDQMPIIQGMHGCKRHVDDMEVIRPDGRHSLLDVFGAPVLDRNGQVKASLVSFMDITARREAEDQLRASKAMLSHVLDLVPQAIFWKDSNSVYLGCNRVFARVVGLAPEQVVGLTDYDLPSTRAEADTYCARDRAVIESGQPQMHITEPVRIVGGEIIWVDTSKIPLVDSSGQVYGILGVFEDITERLKIEKALRLSEEQYRELVQSANSIILRWDREGRITFMNEYGLAFFGYTEAELLGRHVMETIVPSTESTGRDLRPMIDQVLADPEANTQNVNENVRRDGRRIWIAWTNRVLTNEAGEPVGVLSIGNDITERRMMEEALREANRALSELNARLAEADRRKDEFLAMLSHELRNPLAPIRNASYALHVLLPENERVQRQREIIDRQLGHMARLIEDLLDVARITRGMIQLRRERLDLRDVLTQALESCQPRLAGREMDLVYSPPAQPLLLEGDPVRLVQVVCNLLNNAAKFSCPGQPITVELGRRAAPTGAEAWLRVRDAGAGIAPELLPHIFDLFVQADKSLDRTKGGLGLGLTLAQRIAQMHGGHVEAHSAGLGQGSAFTVHLPLAPTEAERPEGPGAESGSRDGAPPPTGGRVLVVDDNTDEADSLGELLELWGYEVRTAYDGPAALSEAAAFRPGIVLLDIGLPRMNGYEVARRLRAESGPTPPRLVAVTGYGQEEDRRLAEQAGFEHHFTKPVDPDHLRHLLKQAA